MRIRTLTLQNFRNYEDETFTFDEGINVLYGRNAQGKTNCAEAVFYLCTGTSPRARKDRQMIRAGQEKRPHRRPRRHPLRQRAHRGGHL